MRPARRLEPLPEYLAARLNRLVAERRAAGRDVISLGVGDPDRSPPAWAREALAAAVLADDTAHYPTNRGSDALRRAVARFYDRRFGVALDPECEILPLLGAKEGLAHLALALLDPGDASLVADPGYPVYASGAILAGAEPIAMALHAARGFQPDLDAIAPADRRRARLLVAGWPNNPTGAVVEDDLFRRLAAFGREHEVVICHDNAYSEITFGGYIAPSFLQEPGAREAGIEVLSLSKAYSLPGWRIAFAVGNREVIGALHKLKTHLDAGMAPATQAAAVALLDAAPSGCGDVAAVYEHRARLVVGRLRAAGIPVEEPRGTMYLWLPIPSGEPSIALAERLLHEQGVVVGPGRAYGAGGEGFIRLALTVPDDRLEEAVDRIVRAL